MSPPGKRIEEPRLGAFARGLDCVLHEPERIELVFQPIVDLGHGVTAGYEALARFDAEPQAPPNEWFAAAERLSVAAELEALVTDRALASREHLPENCFLTINLGPRAACSEDVQRVMSRHGSLAGVVIEITEESAVDDYEHLSDALAPMRDAGALLAVDDAGAGFASLRHVTALRPEFVKIDRELVSDLDRDPARAAIVELFGMLAGRLDAWIIAEGVEREAEVARLIELGVPLAQGFGLARPARDMGGLGDDAQGLLSDLAARHDRGGVGLLRERCPTIAANAPRGLIADLFVRDPDTHTLALVDDDERPIALVSREAFRAGATPVPISLCVQPISDISEVARRAITRPAAQRFDPLACCDECGRLLGVIAVERLIEALAR